MKRFLPLLILAGLLFGQDVLYLKSGEYKKGVFIEKLDNDIVFQIEGESIYTRFSIDLVEIIETNNRKYYYPFNIQKKNIFRLQKYFTSSKVLSYWYFRYCGLL